MILDARYLICKKKNEENKYGLKNRRYWMLDTGC
jgi:hypothetical protein